MASVETIRKITIQAAQTGVDQTTASLNKLSDAQSNVADTGKTMATVTDQSSSKQLSAQSAYDRLRTSIDSNYRSQQQLAKGETVLTNARNQGIISAQTYAQMHDLLIDKYGKTTTLSGAFAQSLSGVKTQMVALAAGAGPVGVFLASFGPWGLAAAAGITLITDAIEAAVREADRLGDVARQVRDISDTTGLAAAQFQALQIAGAAVGLASEQMATGFERFNTQLALLKDGSGNLLATLDRINPQLALQLSSAKDSASAWNILAQAYANADSNQQRLIEHAIAGQRGGAGIGRLLGQTASAGGISGLQANLPTADIISSDQLNKLADLKTQIDQIKASTANIWASIYSEPILEQQKQSAQYMHDLAVAAKDVADAQPNMSVWQRFINLIGGQGVMGEGQQAYIPRSPASLINEQIPIPPYPTTLSPELAPNGPPSPATIASNYKIVVAALGSAATASEQLRAKQLELNAQLQSGAITQETYNRALSGEQYKVSEQALSARIGLLGPAASMTDLLTQAQNRINDARKQGASFTTQETATILANVAAQKLASDTQILVANNVVTADQLRTSKLAELNVLVMQGKLTQDQMNTSMVANQQISEKTIQQQQIAIAQLPQLKQLQLQSGDLRYQMDTFSTTVSTDVGDALVNIGTGANTAGDAFKNLSTQVVTALEQMLVKMAIVQPLAAALQATLGGSVGGGGFNFLGSLFGGSNAAQMSTLNATLPNSFSLQSGGMVGVDGKRTFVHPAYFENAPHFDTGGMITDDGVPIIAHPGERILNRSETAAYNAGGRGNSGVNIQLNPTYNFPANVDPQFRAEMKAYVDQANQKTLVQAVQMVARVKKNTPGYLS